MTTQDDRQAIADLVPLERFHRDRRRRDALADGYVELVKPFYAAADRWLAGRSERRRLQRRFDYQLVETSSCAGCSTACAGA
jgi:hypothetical protein